jgi:hypothetical protein
MKMTLAAILVTAVLSAAPIVYGQEAGSADKDKSTGAGTAVKKDAKTGAKDTAKAAKTTGHDTKTLAKDTAKDAKIVGKGTGTIAKKTGSDIKNGVKDIGHKIKKGDEKPADQKSDTTK